MCAAAESSEAHDFELTAASYSFGYASSCHDTLAGRTSQVIYCVVHVVGLRASRTCRMKQHDSRGVASSEHQDLLRAINQMLHIYKHNIEGKVHKPFHTLGTMQ